jgi:hypothetical protein
VAGYLWLAVFWLAFGQHFERLGQRTRATPQVIQLAHDAVDAIGPLGRVVAISVMAYLVGSLMLFLTSTAWLPYFGRIWIPRTRIREVLDRSLPRGVPVTFPWSSKLSDVQATEIFRVREEARLRLAISVPLLALILVASLRDSPYWAIAAVPAACMFWHGVFLHKQYSVLFAQATGHDLDEEE